MQLAKAVRLFASGGLPAVFEHLRAKSRVKASNQALADVHALSESDLTAKEKFEEIYRRKLWVKAGAVTGVSDSLSGHGSGLASTAVLRERLEVFLSLSSTRILFDAPCGDFNWMPRVRMPSTCDYLGGDIVPSVIDANTQRFSRQKTNGQGGRSFRVFDITADAMPMADVWMCKDCLQHLSYDDIWAALRNFSRSDIPVALITNHTIEGSNHEIPTGGFRFLDLTLPPFSLHPPERHLSDESIDSEPKVLAMWRREQIRDAVARTAL